MSVKSRTEPGRSAVDTEAEPNENRSANRWRHPILRLWSFRIASATIVPAIFLLILEGSLNNGDVGAEHLFLQSQMT